MLLFSIGVCAFGSAAFNFYTAAFVVESQYLGALNAFMGGGALAAGFYFIIRAARE